MAGVEHGDDQLKVLSLNVWGLAFISKDRPTRIRAIAEHLGSTSYDIVCLQELWIYKDFEIIRNEVLQNLPFSRFFHTGALGSGLAIFTRFPLISAQALPYALSGSPHQAIAGDFFVKKAAANVVLLHPVLGEIEVWNTHMHAAGEAGPETNQAHRMAQAWQLSNAIRAGAERGRYILAMGDFNSQPWSIPISILKSHGNLNDSFLDVHPEPSTSSPTSPISPETSLSIIGPTCDSPLNTYSAGKPIPQEVLSKGGKRLDYIFYRQPEVAKRRPLLWGHRETGDDGHLEEGKPIKDSTSSMPILRCSRSEVILTERVPGHAFSYSDHFGLLSTFFIDPPEGRESFIKTHPDSVKRISTESTEASSFTPLLPLDPAPLNDTTTTFATPYPLPTRPKRTSSAKSSVIRNTLNVLKAYAAISHRTARTHIRLFFVAVVLLLGLTVGSAFQPKSYIQPIFTLLAGALGAGGATMLYTGFVWGRWEEGLLREVTEEMELELRVAEMEERASSGS